MAEVAGLVIGSISLATLFDQCISFFRYIDSGRRCSDDYKDSALMLTMIGGRLNRWERTIQETGLQMPEEDVESAKVWLRHIHKRVEDAEKLSERYNGEINKSDRLMDTSSTIEVVQRKVLRNDRFSLAKKTRWALTDREKMQTLVDNLDKLVGNLEHLSLSLQDQRFEMLRNDIAGLVSNNEASTQAVHSLETAAAKVDENFKVVVQETGHIYRNIENTEESMVSIGDYHSGASQEGSPARLGAKHTYDGIRSSGKSTVNIGNMYGKSVFEMKRE